MTEQEAVEMSESIALLEYQLQEKTSNPPGSMFAFSFAMPATRGQYDTFREPMKFFGHHVAGAPDGERITPGFVCVTVAGINWSEDASWWKDGVTLKRFNGDLLLALCAARMGRTFGNGEWIVRFSPTKERPVWFQKVLTGSAYHLLDRDGRKLTQRVTPRMKRPTFRELVEEFSNGQNPFPDKKLEEVIRAKINAPGFAFQFSMPATYGQYVRQCDDFRQMGRREDLGVAFHDADALGEILITGDEFTWSRSPVPDAYKNIIALSQFNPRILLALSAARSKSIECREEWMVRCMDGNVLRWYIAQKDESDPDGRIRYRRETDGAMLKGFVPYGLRRPTFREIVEKFSDSALELSINRMIMSSKTRIEPHNKEVNMTAKIWTPECEAIQQAEALRAGSTEDPKLPPTAGMTYTMRMPFAGVDAGAHLRPSPQGGYEMNDSLGRTIRLEAHVVEENPEWFKPARAEFYAASILQNVTVHVSGKVYVGNTELEEFDYKRLNATINVLGVLSLEDKQTTAGFPIDESVPCIKFSNFNLSIEDARRILEVYNISTD